MRQAISLARKGVGKTQTNPLVGAILLRLDSGQAQIIGKGYHRAFGKPHAEVEAINDAKSRGHEDLSRCILYVTLEPCCHQGKTPPCTDLIIREKIPHVVIGMMDPHELVSGSGMRKLRASGIKLQQGFLEAECRQLNRVYLKNVEKQLPFVIVKWAQSLDGRIATISGDSKWISNDISRRYVHRVRRQVDAIMVGASTVSRDDPQLSVRFVKGQNPKRIILDGRLSVPLNARVFADPERSKTIVMTSKSASVRKVERLRKLGVKVYDFGSNQSNLSLRTCLRKIHKLEGITSILVEGGSKVHSQLIHAKLADEIMVFISPLLIGQGISPVDAFISTQIANSKRLEVIQIRKMGNDMFFHARL